jgi:hypothetical protein
MNGPSRSGPFVCFLKADPILGAARGPLGRRQVVRQRTLDPPSQVRILAPQPFSLFAAGTSASKGFRNSNSSVLSLRTRFDVSRPTSSRRCSGSARSNICRASQPTSIPARPLRAGGVGWCRRRSRRSAGRPLLGTFLISRLYRWKSVQDTLMRHWFAIVAVGFIVSACVTPPTASTPPKATRSPVVTIPPEEWTQLSVAPLNPVPAQSSAACQTEPVPVRAGVVPEVGANPTERRLRVQNVAPVLWQLVGGYSGPILLRGRRADGAAPVYFANLETLPAATSFPVPDGPPLKTLQTSHGTLQLYGGMRLSATMAAQSWWTYVYTESVGCFFWQQDGRDYEGTLTFEVTG